jgi:hypothetical protein
MVESQDLSAANCSEALAYPAVLLGKNNKRLGEHECSPSVAVNLCPNLGARARKRSEK